MTYVIRRKVSIIVREIKNEVKFWTKKEAASTSCLKAMKTIKQCSENRKLETIK